MKFHDKFPKIALCIIPNPLELLGKGSPHSSELFLDELLLKKTAFSFSSLMFVIKEL